MSLVLLKSGLPHQASTPAELELADNCQKFGISCTLEFISGQYCLHSDNPQENPIALEIDKTLTRHEDFFKKSSLQKELLARSIGIKGALRPKVLDLTGGLLGDTLLFLSFGCEVQTLERHPVIAFLIQSALDNAQHPALKRLKFLPQDAATFLAQAPAQEVIYFDPMFEDANLKSSPKKEMRIFRNLVQSDLDAQLVFEMALKNHPKRVVVKRPRLSKPISSLESVEYMGKATRYDVYFPFSSNPLK